MEMNNMEKILFELKRNSMQRINFEELQELLKVMNKNNIDTLIIQ